MGTTPPPEETPPPPRGGSTDDGMVALSYIMAGLILYGGLGWLGDHYLHTKWLLPVGLVAGVASSTYLIIKRYGRLE